MKKKLAIVLLLSVSASAFAVDGGAVLGGALGGAAGAAIGHSMGGRNGAILGGAIGGGTGAAIGSSNTAQARQVQAPTAAPVARRNRDDDEERHHDHGRRHGHDKNSDSED